MASLNSQRPPPIGTIHHLKLASKNILATQSFYTDILGFTPLPQYHHYTPAPEHKLFAVVFEYRPANIMLEARYAPEFAESDEGWDPITWGVGTRADLEKWGEWFDEHNVKRSPVIKGLKSWLIAAEDPDGRRVRLYVTEEEHEWSKPDDNEYWISKLVADPNAEGH